MRVLVTGGAGFIGSHIVDRLLANGHDVLVVDDLSTGRRGYVPDSAQFVRMDMGSDALRALACGFGPDAVSHLAAQASVAVSMKQPRRDAEVNIVAGINAMEAAIASGARQFVYITTGGALYGPPDYLPCDEDHPIRPQSAYGLSKWTLEQYLRLLLPASIPLKVLRLANVYGPRQDPFGEAGVVAIFAERMVRGSEVVIFGDGEQTRDFVYVADVADAHTLALAASDSLTVNVSSAVGLSVNELFRRMAVETGYPARPIHAVERPGDLEHSVLDNRRAHTLLGWEPRTSLEHGVAQTIASLRPSRRQVD
ncbi:MAG TPA: NAD-dependent epimerase/dehydratase family protein [Thermomicrobiaceae bacterium]|nr:NAD-dependent epimerase/dehydratase family protein [Thermomicrobiaceae bacterium]